MRKWLVGVGSAMLLTFGGAGAVSADHGETLNCDAFSSGEEVWEHWNAHGYSADNDPEGFDADSDGQPCESLTDGVPNPGASDGNMNNDDDDNNHNDDNNNNDYDNNENGAWNDDNNHEGNAMSDTATSYPGMMLFGMLAAMAGSLLLIRRRTAEE
ncbi:hypothetical protein [Alkalicoccus urumqiensis]|uniref:Excalibur calcium-binding domain-containing protein n=1 Tax=Alkalicoccus urumqiensis TaxID=1548213 RepID=A0A2P6MLF9_ALKUR|nr:hypothetical protein [Alkalicoccus urumqiensis]PRO67115.1 hypothetical protein C6I21_00675 [Alkalicoccus urumqiensis]